MEIDNIKHCIRVKCSCCLMYWDYECSTNDDEWYTRFKLCKFCEKNPSSLSVLHYIIDNLQQIDMRDFPKVLKRLVKHLDLKERD